MLRASALALGLVLAGCAQQDDFGQVLLHDGEPAARLSPALIGQQVSTAAKMMPSPPIIHEQMADGSEVMIWRQANVHRGLGEPVLCEEKLVARGGTIEDSDRQGNGCELFDG